MIDTVLRIVLPVYAVLAIALLVRRRAQLVKTIRYDPVVMRIHGDEY